MLLDYHGKQSFGGKEWGKWERSGWASTPLNQTSPLCRKTGDWKISTFCSYATRV